MILAQLYSIIYIVLHLGLVYRNWNLITGNGKSGFNLMNIANRIWLLLLDLFVLELLPFQNDLWFFNIYPITIVFGVFFYYVIRYCLRKQYFFQYLTHLYHPQKHCPPKGRRRVQILAQRSFSGPCPEPGYTP